MSPMSAATLQASKLPALLHFKRSLSQLLLLHGMTLISHTELLHKSLDALLLQCQRLWHITYVCSSTAGFKASSPVAF